MDKGNYVPSWTIFLEPFMPSRLVQIQNCHTFLQPLVFIRNHEDQALMSLHLFEQMRFNCATKK
uniref:Uncharacterized protein n=1 Tax=Klebsiella pneumoniae TaxID=573 RepID=A0A8B0SW86_KLEPN|nr:hypothetical protein [Klebsiella pneumoniae]